MPANARNIWDMPAFLPYVQPPLTNAAVRGAEKKIGYKLPKELIELLEVQNGGYLRFRLPESCNEIIAGIGPHFPSLTDFDWDEVRDWVSYELDGLVPFDGDGHWHLCLDYRQNSNEPAVTYVDIECDSQEPIAASFAEFLTLLRLQDDDSPTYVILPDTGRGTSALLDELGTEIGTRFVDMGDYDSGYSTYRAPGDPASEHEWVWLSPNLVPKGFVRRDDPRYQELKDAMQGYGRRYPELRAESFLLNATDKVRQSVLEACIRCGLRVEPLSEILGEL